MTPNFQTKPFLTIPFLRFPPPRLFRLPIRPFFPMFFSLRIQLSRLAKWRSRRPSLLIGPLPGMIPLMAMATCPALRRDRLPPLPPMFFQTLSGVPSAAPLTMRERKNATPQSLARLPALAPIPQMTALRRATPDPI
jgi:hypothetical protein